ncbi:phosphotransferase [Paenibacillus sp. RC67]|uniref:phosphotransferase family protein n=1 Tax=Paenibacillus sp. RC67 TaxID=3039392 RepID=UPI0024ACF485|nr:phosphotransferase [Paenibacillus sp. RC67]
MGFDGIFEGDTLRSTLSNENNRDRKHELIYKFGQALFQIHSTPCPRALVKDGLWLDEMLRRAEINLQKYKVDGTEDLLQFLKNNKPAPVENTLIHGDFTIDNVLVHEGEITSVIDWSGGALGDPRYDVCLAIRPKPNIFEEESEVHTFFEGYGKRSIGESEFHYFEKGLYAFF